MVLALFIDGLGLGAAEPQRNPLADQAYPALGQLISAATPLDACLGVDGLPQSASGQVALFCGVNAPLLVGGHQPGFPGRRLRGLLASGTFYQRVVAAGGRATFLNAFGLAYLKRMVAGQARASASTLAAVAAGLPLRTAATVARGEAIYHDLTGEGLARQGEWVPRMTAATAADVAWHVAGQHHLTLFEFFLTDVAGHRRDPEFTASVLTRLDCFVASLMQHADRPGGPGSCYDCVVVFSDHGNIEDASTSSHTTNPVPLAIWPPGPQLERLLARRRGGIDDVADILVEMAMGEGRAGGS